MKEEKMGKKTKIIIIILVIVLIILLIYSAILNNNKKQENVIVPQNTIQTENINPNLNTDLDNLSKLKQYDRIKYYLDKYLFYIEAQDYQNAYNMLYTDFKQQYFPTLEKFTQYVIKKYPVVNTIEYTEYDKLGKYHVLTITFSDVLNATSTTIPSFKQKYIIVEKGLNDFELSFQAE